MTVPELQDTILRSPANRNEAAAAEPSEEVVAAGPEADLDATIAKISAELEDVGSDATCVTDLGQLQPEASATAVENVPTKIGRYKIVSELGRGGMGSVFKGIDPETDDFVAIKVMNHIAARDEAATMRFHKEAKLLAEVNNPWVANLLDSGDHDGAPFLVMEFVDGTDLRAQLKTDAPFPPHEALMLIGDVARALEPAHQSGIVHRDIKPGNILLSPTAPAQSDTQTPNLSVERQFRVRLADFGLARHIDQSESLQMTQTGAFLGTPVYMSPEQCKGTGNISPESDVYSLGITLFEMLTGHPPFRGDDAMQLAAKHCFEEPPSVTKLNPKVSDATGAIVKKALSKHQSSRYATAGDLLQAIEQVLHGDPTTSAQHPVLPETLDDSVHSAELEWRLKSSPEQLWKYVSDTERINEALGLPAVRYIDSQDSNGLRRFGHFKLAGMSIEWEEHPFEWIEGQRFSVLRDFSKGPFDWFSSVVTLDPLPDGGTLLKHRISIRPRGLIGRLVARMEVDLKARKSLSKVYTRIDRVVRSRESYRTDPFRQPHTLARLRANRLRERLSGLLDESVDGVIASLLGDFLSTAASQEVARIKPKAFAARFNLNADATLRAFLFAARHGLLQLQWDILCPTCRIPSDSRTTLKAVDDHGRCEACDADFALDLAQSIELVFRAHPELRDIDTRTYCIGGPGHSPHVVAQVSLQSQERFEFETQLTAGEYILRGPRLPFTVPVTVSSRGKVVRAEVPLRNGRERLQTATLKEGRQTLTLVNETAGKLQIRLERTVSRRDVVTAAQAASTPEFRQLFPMEAPSRDRLFTVADLSLVLIRFENQELLTRQLGDAEGFNAWRAMDSAVRRCVTSAGGVVVRSEAAEVQATFDTLEKAVDCVMSLHHEAVLDCNYNPAFVIHRGPLVASSNDDRLCYFGRVLDESRTLLAESAPAELLIPSNGPGQDAVIQALVKDACPGTASKQIVTITQSYLKIQLPAHGTANVDISEIAAMDDEISEPEKPERC